MFHAVQVWFTYYFVHSTTIIEAVFLVAHVWCAYFVVHFIAFFKVVYGLNVVLLRGPLLWMLFLLACTMVFDIVVCIVAL